MHPHHCFSCRVCCAVPHLQLHVTALACVCLDLPSTYRQNQLQIASFSPSLLDFKRSSLLPCLSFTSRNLLASTLSGLCILSFVVFGPVSPMQLCFCVMLLGTQDHWLASSHLTRCSESTCPMLLSCSRTFQCYANSLARFLFSLWKHPILSARCCSVVLSHHFEGGGKGGGGKFPSPFARMLLLILWNTFQLHFSCHCCPFILFLGPCPLSSPDSWFASLFSPVEDPVSLPCFFGSRTLSLPGFPLMSKSADLLSPELAWEHER